MVVHTCLLIYICFLGLFIYSKGRLTAKKNKLFLFLSLGAICLIQSLRGASVGWDTYDYILAFYKYKYRGIKLSIESGFEPLYIIINLFVGLFTDNAQWLLAFCSFFILFGIGIFIYYNIHDNISAFWPVFLFMTLNPYFNTMNLLRQSMAMAVGINIYTVLNVGINRKNTIISIILFFFAFFLHSSSIVCLIFYYPFIKKIVKRRIIVFSAVICGVVFLGFSLFLNLFLRIVPRYAVYLNRSRIEGSQFGIYYVFRIVFKLIIILLLLRYDPKEEGNREIYILSFIVMLSIGTTLAQAKTSLAGRLGYYYDFFSILLIPCFINRLSRKHALRLFGKSFVFLWGWVYYLHLQFSTARGCTPYLFFWQ